MTLLPAGTAFFFYLCHYFLASVMEQAEDGQNNGGDNASDDGDNKSGIVRLSRLRLSPEGHP